MRCIGRTKSFTRCKNSARLLFCHHHRFQPVVLFLFLSTIIGLYAGIFQDLIFPLWKRETKARKHEISDSWVRITDTSKIDFQVISGVSGERTIFARGTIKGIVSNPKAHVFLLIREFHRHKIISSRKDWVPSDFWGIQEAVVNASGDWTSSVYNRILYVENPPDFEYWEIMAISTNNRAVVADNIIPQIMAISHETLMRLSGIISSETVVRMRPPESGGGYRIDHNLEPKPRIYYFGIGTEKKRN